MDSFLSLSDEAENKEIYNKLELALLCKLTGQFLAELGHFDKSEQILIHAHEHLNQVRKLNVEYSKL